MSIKLVNIVKDFPGGRALNNVSVGFGFDEVHGLIGENGAGKSTLVNILGGSLAMSHGKIFVRGSAVRLATPRAALLHGIAHVSQEGSLVPQLTGAENILLGAEPSYFGGVLRRQELMEQAGSLLCKWFPEVSISLDRPVGELDVADRKIIEIIRALRGDTSILILDEPTAALQSREKMQLWKIIRSLPARGVGVVLVSHFLSEIKELSDRITVLRDGEHVDTLEAGDTTEAGLIDLMLRRASGGKKAFERKTSQPIGKSMVMEVSNWKAGRVEVPEFSLKAGEIVGLIGLTGAGHFGFARSLYHPKGLLSGTIRVCGKNVAGNVRDMKRSGIALVPDHRMENALMADGSVRENLSLVHSDFAANWGVLNLAAEKTEVMRIVDLLNIKSNSPRQLVRELSGGNKQKVSLGKWLYGAAGKYRVMIFVEPTEGVDIGAKQEIYRQIRDLAKQGMGVLIASSDLLEIEQVTQRVVPFVHGRPGKSIPAEEFSEARFIDALTGEAA
ncbi:MAG TPA: sugar ABC transporter ATP-binding protein [Devosia sp.]|nr:sugar ABC transporter ATP-binding protein [Devosia sp.]